MDIELIPETMPESLRWPIRLPLIDGELLSSWICRLAVANGISPVALHDMLSTEAGPTGKSWLNSPSPMIAEYIGQQTDQPQLEVLKAAPVLLPHLITRYDLVGRIVTACPHLALRRARNGRGGSDEEESELGTAYMVYCPECLRDDEEPYMRRTWRTKLATGCERHEVRLLHCCPHCQKQVKPHLAKHLNGICFCAECGEDLREASAEKLTAREAADISDVMSFLDAILGMVPVEDMARKGESLIRRAILVLNQESNFWHLYFAPNEIGNGLEWMRRPTFELRDSQVAAWGKERLDGAGTVWGYERVVPWKGEIPSEVGVGRLIGYANRFSDGDPNLDRMLDKQIGTLRLVGVPDMLIFVDDQHIGSAQDMRFGLRAALATAKKEDTIVVAGLEFLGRSTEETMSTITRIHDFGLFLWILDCQRHTGSPSGQALLKVIELLEAAQRRRHIAWSKTVIMEGVTEGKYTLGKKPISREKLLEGGRMLLAGIKREAIAAKLGIAKSTLVKHRNTMLALAKQEQNDLESVD